MEVTTIRADLSEADRTALLDIATTEMLVALMRSVGAENNPALRYRLSTLLAQLAAADGLRNGSVECQPHVVEAAECRALADAGEFVADVLGPGLFTDTGNPLRTTMLPLVDASDVLTAQAYRAVESVAADVVGHVIERSERIDSSVSEYRSESPRPTTPVDNRISEEYVAGFSLSTCGYTPTVDLGTSRAVLAAVEQTGSWDPTTMHTQALPVEGGWEITGDKWFVPESDSADLILVVATTSEGPSGFRVERGAVGLDIIPLKTPPADRPLSRMTFRHTPAVLIGEEGHGGRSLHDMIDDMSTTLAGEQMGVVDLALKEITELPPSCSDNESWRRYTRDIAELEILRAGATALWYRVADAGMHGGISTDRPASALARIGCSHALGSVALQLFSVAPGMDSTIVEGIRARARELNAFLGGPAASHQRLIDRLGI